MKRALGSQTASDPLISYKLVEFSVSRSFAGFSSVVCSFAAILGGCSNSQTLSEVEATRLDAEQGQIPQYDEGLSSAEQTPPPIVMPPGNGVQVDSTKGSVDDSSLSIGELRVLLNAALGDIWGVQDNHINVNFILTDGKFTITPTTIDGVTHKDGRRALYGSVRFH